MREARKLMSQADYARHRGQSRQYINRLAKAGVLVMRNGKVHVSASDAVLDDRPVLFEPGETSQTTQPRPAAEPLGSQPTNFAQARLAEMVFRAKLRRLDYETRSAKVIPADEVKARWFVISRRIRDKLLAFPARISLQLAALAEPQQVRALLETEITATLRALQEEIRHPRP